ncbi:MAG: hypothetical protein KDA91_14310 [Planctomycetaceae bacterium]|nr:hypothetical protein [Planctomycetaceae bacterium]
MAKDVSDSPMLELTLETAETVADNLLDSDVLKEIPVVGTALKLCKAADNVRNRLFIAKLQRFLLATNVDPDTKAKWRAKASASPEEAAKIGESICLMLDRLADLTKAELIGTLFVAYTSDVIDHDKLQRLTQAIDVAFIADIKMLLSKHKLPEDSTEPWMMHLVPSGLTQITGGKTLDSVGAIYCNATKLGHSLRNAYFHARRLVDTAG